MSIQAKSSPGVKAALFDVDGTLVNSRVWRGILEYPQVDSWRVRQLYGKALPRFALLKLNPHYEVSFRDWWVRGLARLLAGWPQKHVARMAEWIAGDYLTSMYRADVIDVLKHHRDEGHPVVLVSTMFPIVLEQIGNVVGAGAVVGTQLEVINSTLTGRIVGLSCVGPRKLDFARAYLAEHHPDIPISACAAYADSWSDVPLLEAAATACAVYPDEKLREAACQRGWRVQPPDISCM